MEFGRNWGFRDAEHEMEVALQNTRLQLIAMVEDDEALQSHQDICCCPANFNSRSYQLFDSAVNTEGYQVPPPASQVPMPYWIHGYWDLNDDLTQTWMKIKAEHQKQTKAEAQLVANTVKRNQAYSEKTLADKIHDWRHASTNPAKKVLRKVREEKMSTHPPPAWPPTKDSPWSNTKQPKEEVNYVVAEFFQKFRTPDTAALVKKTDTGYARMFPFIQSGMDAVTKKTKYTR